MGLLPPAPRCLFHLSPPGLLSSGSRGLGAGAAGGVAGPALHGAVQRCVALFLSLARCSDLLIQAHRQSRGVLRGSRSTVSIRPKDRATAQMRGVESAQTASKRRVLASGL